LTIKSGNTLGRLEDWKIGYRFIQPSSLPIFQQQLPVLKIKIDHEALFISSANSSPSGLRGTTSSLQK
jgi:hypothetical protein